MPQVQLPDGQILNFPDGMSQDQMREAIYARYPQYRQQAQVPQEAQGITGMLRDALAGAASGVGGAVQEAFALPGQAYAAGKEVLSHPLKSALNVGAGIGEGAIGLANLPGNVAQYLNRKGMVGDWAQNVPQVPQDLGIESALGLGQGEGEQVLRGLGSFAAPGGAVSRYAGGLSRGRKLAATGALASAGQNQDPIRGAVEAAMLNKMAEVAPRAVQKTAQAVRYPYSTAFETTLSPEELQRNAAIAGETETGLGQILQNPSISKNYENKLRSQVGSGINQQMMRVRDELKTRGRNLIENMSQGMPEKGKQYLVQALKDAAQVAQNKKELNFDKLDARANQLGVKVGRSNLQKTARQFANELKASDEIKHATPKELQSYLDLHMDNNKDYSVKQSDIYRGLLGEKAYKAHVKGDKTRDRIYSALKSALESDIEEALNNAKDPKLQSLRDEAFRHYREEYAPFQAREIKKFTDFGGDPDTILNSFIKTGRDSDRGVLLSKLMDKLPSNAKRYIPAMYYSRALHPERGVNPMQLATLHNKLGEEQRKILHSASPQTLQDMNDYSRLVGMNTKAADIMWNPETGATLLAGKFPATTSLIGSILAGEPGAIIGALAPMVGANMAGKFLTSPKWRRKIIDKISSEKERQRMNMSDAELNKLVAALKNWQNRNTQGQ